MQIKDVEFHSDGYGQDRHPAVNVKYRGRYPQWGTAPEDVPAKDWERIGELVWESACESFWEMAEEIARERGYAGVFSEGRSGGWCVPYYQSRSSVSYRGMNHGKPGVDKDWAGPIRYPDLEGDWRGPAVNVGELSRFRAFQRRILALLEGADDYISDELAYRLEEYREDRAALLEVEA